MPEPIRTFIAVKIEPQPALIELLGLLKKTFAHEKIKWVEKNNLHLTLKFLGKTSPVQVEQVKTVLQETADNFTAFQF
ncbi:MAG: 2'-5' RNA ligase family protein, partial [Tangfeifania sp.]